MKDFLIRRKKFWLVTGLVLFMVVMISGAVMHVIRQPAARPQEEPRKQAEPAQAGVGTVTSNDVWVLSKIISGEARGETYVGQVAVGAVICNRVRNPNFPNSVYGVVFEPGAFDAITDGQYFSPPVDSAVKAARAAINGWDPTSGAIYYWNPATATSSWIWSRPIVARIGKHVFAR